MRMLLDYGISLEKEAPMGKEEREKERTEREHRKMNRAQGKRKKGNIRDRISERDDL